MSYISLKHKEVSIKKARACNFCGVKHQPGDKMVVEAGVLDGDFGSYHMCLCCDSYLTANPEVIEDGIVCPDFPFEQHYKHYKAQYRLATS